MRDERIARALAAAPVAALPEGFRDAVMHRLAAQRSRVWELVVAAVFAVPSLAYVGWVLARDGGDFAETLGALLRTAQDAELSAAASPSFFIDGLVVLAVALLGLASVVAAHAFLAPRDRRSELIR